MLTSCITLKRSFYPKALLAACICACHCMFAADYLTHMLYKILIAILATLLCIYLDTLILEYFLNEASSTLLTTVGLVLFILLTGGCIGLVYRLFKKHPKYPIKYD